MGKEAWDTTSGLLDEYDMTIEEAWFGKPAEYRKGEATVLVMRGEASVEEDGESVVADEEKSNFYSLGDGWEPDDGGEAATHGSGKVKVNENASLGKLITAVKGLGDDVLEEIASRGDPLQAATWRGLRFRFERTPFTMKDRQTNEDVTYYVELPVEYLGVEDTPETKSKAPKKKSGGKKSSGSKGKASGKSSGGRRRKKADDVEDEGGDGNALRDAVIQFAAEWEDHDGFMEAVLDPDEFDQADDVQADEELLNDVIDEDGEIWAASREIEPE